MAHKIITNTDAGFFSNFRSTLSTMKWLDSIDHTFNVNWSTSLYNDPEKGDNAWDYYFEQPYPKSPGERSILKYMARVPAARTAYCEMIEKYVHLNKDTNDILISTIDKMRSDFLGVHIRQTDKNTVSLDVEPAEGRPVEVEKYVEEIELYLKKNPNHNIWLATDCVKSLNCIVEKFGDRVFYRENSLRSETFESIHTGHKNYSGYKKGLDVLIDCLMLSNSKYLIKGSSSVAVCAMLFTPDLACSDLNYNYNKDLREQWVAEPI